jgi:tRNA-dihydrouridine synthase C
MELMSKLVIDPPRILLAPMEGVMESVMRDMLTRIGGYERCVTEFVRVSSTVLPPKVYYRLCPELKQGGRTAAGTPVYVQLLGSDPVLMAANAAVAAKLGAPGIDLNFGCPAKTVNKSRGGATLLRTPEAVYEICSAVRDATPAADSCDSESTPWL